MNLGLRRHTMRVVDHDPGWLDAGRLECDRLRRIGGGLILDVAHVGSTSVAGLRAKPILDIAVQAVSAASIPELIGPLTRAGHIDRGDQGDEGGYLFVRESQPSVRVAHVHIVAQGDRQWVWWLGFRDALRADVELRDRYARLKADLAARFAEDRLAYTQAKHDFIRDVLARAGANPSTREPGARTDNRQALGWTGYGRRDVVPPFLMRHAGR